MAADARRGGYEAAAAAGNIGGRGMITVRWFFFFGGGGGGGISLWGPFNVSVPCILQNAKPFEHVVNIKIHGSFKYQEM